MTLETRLRNTGFPPSGGGGSSSNSGGLAGTGGLFVVTSASPLFPNSRILTAGSSITIVTDGVAVYVSAITNAIASSGGLMGTANFLVVWSSDPLLSNEKILTAGSSIIIRTDAGAIYIDATTGGGSGTPGGSDTQIQVNSQNAFAAFANLRWINSSNSLDLNTAGRLRHGGAAEVDGLTPTGVTGLLWLDTSSNYTSSSTTYPLAANSGGTGLTAPYGLYQPGSASVANLDAISVTSAQYLILGSTVTVSGRFTADPTLPATQTTFAMTLPVASALANSADLAGVAFSGNIAGMGAEVMADQTNDRAQVTWVSGDTTSQSWSYIYLYQVK